MAIFLNQADLDYMRAQQIEMIAEIGGIGSIKRPVRTADGYGGYTETFNTQANIPMRLWISSGPNGTSQEARFWSEQELNETDAFVTLAWNADIKITDHITFENRDWRVIGLQYKDAHWTAIRLRVVALRDRT